MSPRAAWRLESMGFAEVYDYVAGKADWGAAGLPLEGTAGPRVGELARRDVPTCRLDEPLGGSPQCPGQPCGGSAPPAKQYGAGEDQ